MHREENRFPCNTKQGCLEPKGTEKATAPWLERQSGERLIGCRLTHAAPGPGESPSACASALLGVPALPSSLLPISPSRGAQPLTGPPPALCTNPELTAQTGTMPTRQAEQCEPRRP